MVELGSALLRNIKVTGASISRICMNQMIMRFVQDNALLRAGTLCKRTPICQYAEVVIFVVYNFLTFSFV